MFFGGWWRPSLDPSTAIDCSQPLPLLQIRVLARVVHIRMSPLDDARRQLPHFSRLFSLKEACPEVRLPVVRSGVVPEPVGQAEATDTLMLTSTVPSSFADFSMLKPRCSRLVLRRLYSLIIVALGKEEGQSRRRTCRRLPPAPVEWFKLSQLQSHCRSHAMSNMVSRSPETYLHAVRMKARRFLTRGPVLQTPERNLVVTCIKNSLS